MVAQEQNDPIIPETPPSPQAVAFNRLGEYQVNNNYGAPDINIPLWEIDFYGYKIPLTLHYEAKPLKPGYNYDVTGLGWTLSGNSCVSRTIMDRPDEDGMFGNPFQLDKWKNSSGQDKLYLDYEREKWLDKVNYQYDRYNIVLPSGRSIPFFMYMVDKKMAYKMLKQDNNVKIEFKRDQSGSAPIKSFTVTDEKGVKYYFTKPEKALSIYEDDNNAEKYVTWLLTSIDIPSKGTIEYQYTKDKDEVTIDMQENHAKEPVITIYRLSDDYGESYNKDKFKVRGTFTEQCYQYKMHFLQSISYGPTKIDFTYIKDADKRPHMNEIIVSDQKPTGEYETIRKFTLNHSNIYSYDKYGSHLESVVISGQNDVDKLKYSFTYSRNNPGVISNPTGRECTDYWGNICKPGPSATNYYNNYGLDNIGNFNMFFDYDGIGKTWEDTQKQLRSNGVLAQLIERKDGEHTYYWKMKLQTTTDGDTRIPTSPEFHGVLTSITYPNGGRTSFNWENHRFPTASAADGDFVYDRRSQRIIEGGGFRIESIINCTADGKIASADYYRYGYTLGDIIHRNFPLPLPDNLNVDKISFKDTINTHIGCGEAVVDPNLFTFMNGFSFSAINGVLPNPGEFRKMLIGLESRFADISSDRSIIAYKRVPTWWEATFSANKFRSLIGGRQPVVYPEITVYHGGRPEDAGLCKSKTVYRYNIYKYQYLPEHESSYMQYSNYLSSINQIMGTDTVYFEPLSFCDPQGLGAFPALSCSEFPADRHLMESKYEYSYNTGKNKWELISEEKNKYDKSKNSIEGYIFESFISRENNYPDPADRSSNNYQPLNSEPLAGMPLRTFYKMNYQYLGKSDLIEKVTTVYRQGGKHSDYNKVTEQYDYKFGTLKRKTASTEKDVNEEKYIFVGEIDGNDIKDKNYKDAIVKMQDNNMLTALVSSTKYVNDISMWPYAVSGSKTYYSIYDGSPLPARLSEFNFKDTYWEDGWIIDDDQYDPVIEVVSYASSSCPREIVDLKTGIHSVILWDYYGRYMTAMIKNATYADVEKITLTGDSQSRYTNLKKNLPKAQIQTWDYRPLIGVSSYTDVNGQTIVYEYDGLGRLKSEKRKVNGVTNPEILREYEYNFINE